VVAQHGGMTFEYLGPLTPQQAGSPDAIVRHLHFIARVNHPAVNVSKTPIEMSPEGLQWRTIQTVIEGD
jgi:hypothetical protein